jgi:RNA polymerase sigma-70 factor (ECF subfamily)
MPAIHRYFARRAGAEETDDLAQEVYLHMLARADVTGIDNLEGYVFQVAANVLAAKGRRDRVRHTRQHIELNEFHHPVEESSPERILMERQLLKSISTAVLDLPVRTREVFVLHRFEEMTYGAIAAHLQISVSAVEKHIMRAMRLLTARMKLLGS